MPEISALEFRKSAPAVEFSVNVTSVEGDTLMDTSNRRLVSLVIGLLRVIRADGALPRMLDEVDQIDDHFLEFQESVPSVGRPGERVPLINRPAAGSRRYEVGCMSPSVSTKIEALSPRQCEVLNLIAEGQSNKEIARILDITPETVKTHVRNIFIKLSVEKRAHAVSRARNLGLASYEYREFTQ
jgi:LuxR family maltose regulon positive regulatory protein